MFYSISDFANVLMYISFERYVPMIVYIIVTIKTLVFLIFALKSKKPNLFLLLLFEFLILTSSLIAIFILQNMLDFIVLAAMLLSTYGSWQDNNFVLRVTYLSNRALLVTYYFIIGAYISFGACIGFLFCEILCFIYYCILKKETPLMQVIFKNRKKESENIQNNTNESENLENKISIDTEEQINQNVT